MRRLATTPFLVVAVIVSLLGNEGVNSAHAQATPAREIIIHYRPDKAALPAPHRDGNTYVITVPRTLEPAPEKLAAPFANDIEGDNEVWRFQISDTTRVSVAELNQGTIRVRLVDGATVAAQQDSPHDQSTDPARPEQPEDTKRDLALRKMKTTLSPTNDSHSSSLEVDANGAALTIAEMTTDSDTDRVKSEKLPFANLDLSVPTSPAFAILGITPDNVIRPTSPRELGMALLNGVGPDGTFQSGVAIDTAPYLLLAGKNKTLADYRDHYSIRFLSRTQFSFATAKGAQDKDPSLKLALGLHFIFFDNGDPRLDDVFIGELRGAARKSGFIEDEPSAIEAAKKEWQTDVARIRKEAKARNWNKSSWSLGLAPSWIDKTGDSGNYDWNGGAIWTSLAYGFDTEPFLHTGLDKNSQLIVHLRYRNHEQIPDPAATGSFFTQDNALAALRLRIGSPDFNVSLDASYVRAWNSGMHDGNSWRAAMILERKMAPNLWFRLSYGKEFDTPDGNDTSLVLGSFHLGASQEATLSGARE